MVRDEKDKNKDRSRDIERDRNRAKDRPRSTSRSRNRDRDRNWDRRSKERDQDRDMGRRRDPVRGRPRRRSSTPPRGRKSIGEKDRAPTRRRGRSSSSRSGSSTSDSTSSGSDSESSTSSSTITSSSSGGSSGSTSSSSNSSDNKRRPEPSVGIATQPKKPSREATQVSQSKGKKVLEPSQGTEIAASVAAPSAPVSGLKPIATSLPDKSDSRTPQPVQSQVPATVHRKADQDTSSSQYEVAKVKVDDAGGTHGAADLEAIIGSKPAHEDRHLSPPPRANKNPPGVHVSSAADGSVSPKVRARDRTEVALVGRKEVGVVSKDRIPPTSKTRASSTGSSSSRSSSPRKRYRSRSKDRKPVERQHRRSPSPVLSTLYVGNLTRNVGRQHAIEIFGTYGRVVNVTLPIEPFTGSCRGFAYIEMSRPEEAESARRYMDGGQIDGQIIVVQIQGTNMNRPRNSSHGPSMSPNRGGRRRSPHWERKPPRESPRDKRASKSPVRQRRPSRSPYRARRGSRSPAERRAPVRRRSPPPVREWPPRKTGDSPAGQSPSSPVRKPAARRHDSRSVSRSPKRSELKKSRRGGSESG